MQRIGWKFTVNKKREDMKINLTKLLESPTRVVLIGQQPEQNITAYYVERENQSTATKSPYSFELEKDEFILEDVK
jgi:hypothetical protein